MTELLKSVLKFRNLIENKSIYYLSEYKVLTMLIIFINTTYMKNEKNINFDNNKISKLLILLIISIILIFLLFVIILALFTIIIFLFIFIIINYEKQDFYFSKIDSVKDE